MYVKPITAKNYLQEEAMTKFLDNQALSFKLTGTYNILRYRREKFPFKFKKPKMFFGEKEIIVPCKIATIFENYKIELVFYEETTSENIESKIPPREHNVKMHFHTNGKNIDIAIEDADPFSKPICEYLLKVFKEELPDKEDKSEK